MARGKKREVEMSSLPRVIGRLAPNDFSAQACFTTSSCVAQMVTDRVAAGSIHGMNDTRSPLMLFFLWFTLFGRVERDVHFTDFE